MCDTLISTFGQQERQRFSPYDDNGGSVVAVAGEDFVVIASDTRLSAGYSIYSREESKMFKLTDKTILGSTGCWADVVTFRRVLDARLTMYRFEHNIDISTTAIAQLISIMLYHKRFFPYYISNVLAGLDSEGHGCVFHYDPIGHCERMPYCSGGSSNALLQPLLDNQIGKKNMLGVEEKPMALDTVVALVKDVFISAAERDICTGDGIIVTVITKDGIKEEYFDLRKD